MKRFVSALMGFLFMCAPALGGSHGIVASVFNGGKVQAHPPFPGISGDYPFTNFVLNSSGGWTPATAGGNLDPRDFDTYGYPAPGTATMSAGGVKLVVRMPAQAYIKGNCIPTATGYCLTRLVNGKGTATTVGTIITNALNSGTASVATGSVTEITFTDTQDFYPGMEVPLSGSPTVTLVNYVGGTFIAPTGTTTAWTVCAAGLTVTKIRLCLNDQVTPLQTTGVGGVVTVTYGRTACGVAAACRYVERLTTSPVSFTPNITAQDAATPITYRNGIPGMAIVSQGGEEIRYRRWLAGTCDGCQFSANNLATYADLNPARLRTQKILLDETSMEVAWADRKKVGYYSYGAPVFDRDVSTYVQTTSVNNNYSITFGSGQPTDHQQYLVKFDATQTITVSNGAHAQVALTAHGFTTGQPFNFYYSGAGALPGGTVFPSGNLTLAYYVIAGATCQPTPCDTNHFQFATSKTNAFAGTDVTTGSTGTNVLLHTTTIPDSGVTMSSGAGGTVNWTNNRASVNDLVQCGPNSGGSLPAELFAAHAYYVESAATNSVTLKKTTGGSKITFSAGSTGTLQCTLSPTVSVNGGAPIAISDRFGFGIGQSSSSPILAFQTPGNGTIYGVLTYDKVLNLMVKTGSDVSIGNSYYNSGWPPEVILAYAKAIASHIWTGVPMYAMDGYTDPSTHVGGATDYLPELYNYIKQNKPSWMIHAIEMPNELWNNLYPSTSLGIGHGQVYAGLGDASIAAGWASTSGTNNIAGKYCSIIGQIAKAVYGTTTVPNRNQYQVMCGVQTVSMSSAGYAAANAERETASNYVGQTKAAQTGLVWSGGTINFALDPAYKWQTHVAAANYFTPGFYYRNVPKAIQLAIANAGAAMNGSIAGGTNQLTATIKSVGAGPAFPAIDVGSVLLEGPGIQPGTTINGTCGANCWTLDRTYADPVSGTDIYFVASTTDTNATKTMIDSSINTASFSSGSISGSTLTVSGASPASFVTTNSGNGGDFVFGAGINDYTQVVDQLTADTQTAAFTGSLVGTGGSYNGSTTAVLSVTAMTSGTVSVTDFIGGGGGAANSSYIIQQATGSDGSTCNPNVPTGVCNGQIGTYLVFPAFQSSVSVTNAYVGGKGGTYSLKASHPTVGPVAVTVSSIFSLPMTNVMYRNAYTYAQTYCNGDGSCNGTTSFRLAVAAYEGCYSPDYLANGISMADQLAFGGKFATGLYGVVMTNNTNFVTQGGEYPAMLGLTGLSPSNQAWAILEDIYQPVKPPEYNAYKAFNLP